LGEAEVEHRRLLLCRGRVGICSSTAGVARVWRQGQVRVWVKALDDIGQTAELTDGFQNFKGGQFSLVW